MDRKFSIADLRAFLQTMGQGLKDRIRPADELSVAITKAPQVFCLHCRKVIGYIKDAALPAALANMAPLAGKEGPGWDCPHCGKDVRAWLPQGAAIKTSKGVLPC